MKKTVIVAAIVLVVLLVFFLVDKFVLQKKDVPVAPETTLNSTEVQQPPVSPEGQQPSPVISKRIIEDVEKEKGFEGARQELMAICRELDEKEYVKAYKLNEGTYPKFVSALEKLAYNPPVISGETKDLYTLLSNAAHFCRVAGKEDIRLVKDILEHENSRIEALMAVMYEYLITGSQEGKLMINIGQLYEYAGFFLNTLGGKGYLYRRDSTTRTLTLYYSVLILDKANKEKMNPYGIDIMPHLKLVKMDLMAHKGLAGTEQYLAELQNIEKTTIR